MTLPENEREPVQEAASKGPSKYEPPTIESLGTAQDAQADTGTVIVSGLV